MITSAPPINTASDRILLPISFDAAKMKAEVDALNLRPFMYYESIPLRAPAHQIDPTVPFPPPASDFADGSWCDWLDVSFLSDLPYITSVVDYFKEHTKVNLVRLLHLEAGAVVKEHTDPTLGLQIEKSVIRLTVPISGGDQVDFYLNNKIVPMQPGECWYMRLTDPHKIIHQGPEERINLTIDMIPNEWVQQFILDAEKGKN